MKGGFVQLSHGKKAPLQKLRAGDGLIMYSPHASYPDGAVLQLFTAVGEVTSGHIYQVEMTPDFRPYRRDVRFLKCHEVPIKKLMASCRSSRTRHTGVESSASVRSRYQGRTSTE